MTRNTEDQGQAMQRVKVGMTGLAGVVVLIGLASAVFSSATHEKGRAPAAQVARNVIVTNTTEPLAEIGAAPSAPDTFANGVQTAAAH